MEENHPKSPIFRKRSNLKTKSTDKEEEEIEFFPATPQKYSRAAETVKSYRLMLEKKMNNNNNNNNREGLKQGRVKTGKG